MMVRAVLGAGRARLAGQLLTEGTVLGAAGGVAGIGIALLGTRLLRGIAPSATIVAGDGTLIWTMLGYGLVSVIVTVLIFALVPAMARVRAALDDGALRFEGSAAGALPPDASAKRR